MLLIIESKGESIKWLDVLFVHQMALSVAVALWHFSSHTDGWLSWTAYYFLLFFYIFVAHTVFLCELNLRQRKLSLLPSWLSAVCPNLSLKIIFFCQFLVSHLPPVCASLSCVMWDTEQANRLFLIEANTQTQVSKTFVGRLLPQEISLNIYSVKSFSIGLSLLFKLRVS